MFFIRFVKLLHRFLNYWRLKQKPLSSKHTLKTARNSWHVGETCELTFQSAANTCPRQFISGEPPLQAPLSGFKTTLSPLFDVANRLPSDANSLHKSSKRKWETQRVLGSEGPWVPPRCVSLLSARCSGVWRWPGASWKTPAALLCLSPAELCLLL